MSTPFVVPAEFNAAEVTVENRRTYNSVAVRQDKDIVLLNWDQLPALIGELTRLYEIEVGPLDKSL